MPFQPPQTPNLLPLLLQHTLNQRAQEDARRQSEEDIARRRADAAFDQAVQLTPQVGWKAAVSGVGPDFPTDRLEFVKGLDKALKARQAENTQVSAAQQSAPDIAAMLANPNLEAQGGQALQQSILGLQSRPELLPILMQQVGQGRDMLQEGQRQAEAAKQTAQQEKLATERRAEGRTIATERRAYGREDTKNLESDIRSFMSEAQVAGKPLDPAALAQEISQRFGKPLSAAELLVDRVALTSQGDVLKIKRTERGQQGKQAGEIEVDSVQRGLEREFPGLKMDPVELEDHARALLKKREIRDDLAEMLFAEEGTPRPVFHRVPNEAAATQFEKDRRQQELGLKSIEDLTGYVGLLSEELKAGRISPQRMAAESWTEFGKHIGINPPLVAAFENVTYQFASAVAALTQGGGKGVSDFDMRNVMTLPPTLAELALNPETALAKVQQLRANARDQIMASSNPKLRDQLSSVSRIKPSALEQRVTKKAREIIARFTAADTSGNKVAANKAATELLDLANKIPKNDATESSPEMQKLLEAYPELEVR